MSTAAEELPKTDDLLAEIIDASMPAGDFIPAVWAEKIVAQLQETQPLLLEAWLHDHAVVFLTDFITHRLARQRRVVQRQAGRSAFAEAARLAAEGNVVPLRSLFEVVLVVDDKNTRRRQGEMTGEDHRYVATSYAASAKPLLLLEAFHQAVAKRIGKRRTSEVFTEEKFAALYRSITGIDG